MLHSLISEFSTTFMIFFYENYANFKQMVYLRNKYCRFICKYLEIHNKLFAGHNTNHALFWTVIITSFNK